MFNEKNHPSPRFRNVPLKQQEEFFESSNPEDDSDLVEIRSPHFTFVGPDRETLQSDYEKHVYDRVITFTHEAAEAVRKIFSEELSKVTFTTDPARKKDFLRYIQEHNLDYPEFTYRVGMDALDNLHEIGLYDEKKYDRYKRDIDQGDPFNTLVFRLPKSLDQFWEKDVVNRSDGSFDVGEKIIPWGHIYRTVIPVIWELRDKYEEDGTLYLDRINESGDHKIGEYYYAWVGQT